MVYAQLYMEIGTALNITLVDEQDGYWNRLQQGHVQIYIVWYGIGMLSFTNISIHIDLYQLYQLCIDEDLRMMMMMMFR